MRAEQEVILCELYATLDKLETFVKVQEVPEWSELIDLALQLRDRATRLLGSPDKNPSSLSQA